MLSYVNSKFKCFFKNNHLFLTIIVGNRGLFICKFLLISSLTYLSISTSFADSHIDKDIEKINKICAEAEIRYKKLFPKINLPKNTTDTVIIKLYKYTFCPPHLEVSKGTKIQFVNVDKRTSHSVWFKDNGDNESERFFPEETVEMFFNEIGEFDYLCGPHWQSDNMRGSLKIKE